jgi:peptide/nickel transport system substrate-binding protein
MKASFKAITFFCLCFLFFAAPGLHTEALSAPQGKIVVALPGDPTTLDPHMHSESFAFAVHRNIYDHLVSRAFDKDGRIEHFPMLATSWEAINDTTWVFHLRKGVKFHNGEEFTSEAVKYSIERMLNPAQKARYRSFFTQIDRVEAVDPFTVRIITKGPMPTLVLNLGYVMSIVPPKYFKEKGDAYVATHPVGTGPFKFARWTKDTEIVLEANESYWAGSPKIKTLVFKPIPEDSTRIAALLGGDVDIAKKIPTHLVDMVNKSKRATVMSVPSALCVNIHFDTIKDGPLKDKRVRQAINYGVDKETIIKTIFEGYAKPLSGALSPFHFGYDPGIKPYPYDPEKAKTLLKDAGYKDNLSLVYNSSSGRYEKDKEFAEAIVGQLAKIGINVKLEIHEWGNYNKKLYSPEGAGPLYVLGWAGSFDGDGSLYPLLGCGQPLSKWCNKQFDGLLDQARATLDQKKRERLYSQALKLSYDEAPMLFLLHGFDTYGVSNRVQDWKPSPYEALSMYMFDEGMDAKKSPWIKD